jgi:CRP-like cAMP-binding protein
MGRSVKDGAVSDYQLALLSRSIFDIGPRTRFLILLFGIVGIGVLFMECLVGWQPQTIPLDKIIHFSGYLILSTTFVLALRPLLFIPGLIGLVAMGVIIEFLQRHTGRSFDWMDASANTLGVVVGGGVGLTVRGIVSYLRKEAAARRVRGNLHSFAQGETLIREGDPIDEMYIIKQGRLRAMRNINGHEVEIAVFAAGDVVGVLGVVERKPQYATLRALEPTVVYRMSMSQLMESAGGDELPVSHVITGLCIKLRTLADQLSASGKSLANDHTLA